MDAVLFIGFALFLTISMVFFDKGDSEAITIKPEDTTREAKLNDTFYDDPNAFSLIINALGFPKEGGS